MTSNLSTVLGMLATWNTNTSVKRVQVCCVLMHSILSYITRTSSIFIYYHLVKYKIPPWVKGSPELLQIGTNFGKNGLNTNRRPLPKPYFGHAGRVQRRTAYFGQPDVFMPKPQGFFYQRTARTKLVSRGLFTPGAPLFATFFW